MNEVQHTGPVFGNILVIGGSDLINRLIAMMLAKMGMDAKCFHEPDAAIEAYRIAKTNGQSYDLVIMSLNIAGDTVAVDVLNEFKRVDPSVKAIVTSGSVFDDVMLNYQRYGFRGALNKPFTIKDLEIAVQSVMEK